MMWLFGSSPQPAFDLKDKIVVVTGASSGIGKRLAQELDRQGSIVVLAARRTAELEAIASSAAGDCLAIKADVTKEDDCKELILQTIEKYGRLDVLVCNAGISQTKHFDQYDSLQHYHDMMETNYFGTINCVHYALPHLKSSQGMIVAISSMTGRLGVPSRTGYAASKHAIHGFLDSLRLELLMKEDNIHIMTACPGYVRTDIRSTSNDGVPDPINSTDIMEVEECVKMICEGIESKKREIYVVSSFLASLGPAARWFLPSNYIDRTVIKRQMGGKT